MDIDLNISTTNDCWVFHRRNSSKTLVTWSNFFCFFSRLETICLWWSRSTVRSSNSCCRRVFVFSIFSKPMVFSSKRCAVSSKSFWSFFLTSSRLSMVPRSSSSFFLLSDSCESTNEKDKQQHHNPRISTLAGVLPEPGGSGSASLDSCVLPHPLPAVPEECSSPPPAGEGGCWGWVSDASPPEGAPGWHRMFMQFIPWKRNIERRLWVCCFVQRPCFTCWSWSWLSSPLTSLAVLIHFLSASSSKADTLSNSVFKKK